MAMAKLPEKGKPLDIMPVVVLGHKVGVGMGMANHQTVASQRLTMDASSGRALDTYLSAPYSPCQRLHLHQPTF
jgi:hypothetical protein